MENVNKPNNFSKKAKFKPGTKKRENKCIVTFDDKDRQEFLTGFHKRKVERRKAALSEIRKKIKEEQNRLREERHKEYMKMLKERREALEEDELEDMITGTTESVQYDHPNHTVTVTTISDLDLTRSHLVPAENLVNGDGEDENEEKGGEEEEKTIPVPKKAGNHMTNKKIRSLRASLSTFTHKRKRKGKQEGRGQRGRFTDKNTAVSEFKSRTRRTTKQQRRRRMGNKVHHQD
ncbi:nucleolar protein 12 [Thalassophryne amazonica]|uniref:nucleolar protein 12 n=1 Tax=Thalassophryne amazonica TaxID=390379 RepID=UPI0014709B21|nr:nucleolar protein 12 [Thalassophryne amazonica]